MRKLSQQHFISQSFNLKEKKTKTKKTGIHHHMLLHVSEFPVKCFYCRKNYQRKHGTIEKGKVQRLDLHGNCICFTKYSCAKYFKLNNCTNQQIPQPDNMLFFVFKIYRLCNFLTREIFYYDFGKKYYMRRNHYLI